MVITNVGDVMIDATIPIIIYAHNVPFAIFVNSMTIPPEI